MGSSTFTTPANILFFHLAWLGRHDGSVGPKGLLDKRKSLDSSGAVLLMVLGGGEEKEIKRRTSSMGDRGWKGVSEIVRMGILVLPRPWP